MSESEPRVYTTDTGCAYCGGPLGDGRFEVDAFRVGAEPGPAALALVEANFCSQAHLLAELTKPPEEWWVAEERPLSPLVKLGIFVAAAVTVLALPVVWVVGVATIVGRLW